MAWLGLMGAPVAALPETMADELPIQREETETEGRYVIYLPDGGVAEMTYHKTGPQSIAIDHTGVPDALRGRGAGQALVQRALHFLARDFGLCAAHAVGNDGFAVLRAAE